MDKIPIGISSCLLGHKVRYDGGHKRNSHIETSLGQFFKFSAFCPEVESGMGIPRPPIQLLETGQGVRCVVALDRSIDVTDKLEDCAAKQHAWLSGLCGYIAKQGSPSCGMEKVKVYRHDHPSPVGTGIFTQYIKDHFPLLPLEEEVRIEDPKLRENFIQRVLIMHRWQRLCAQPLTVRRLTEFHKQLKLVAMSHEQTMARMLEKIAASANNDNLTRVADDCIKTLMACTNQSKREFL